MTTEQKIEELRTDIRMEREEETPNVFLVQEYKDEIAKLVK